jgi:hemolysin III
LQHWPRRDEFPAYTDREVVADAIVHAIGLMLGLAGCATLVMLARAEAPYRALALTIYATCLMAMLVCSALYNLAPAGARKSLLRRLDHAAIYLLIAGSYTPFGERMMELGSGLPLLLAVWALAAVGVALKLLKIHIPEPWSSLNYLLLGWIVLLAMKPLVVAVPPLSVALLVAGGCLYTSGVAFHLWTRLPYQNPIWHAFVVVAATCHFAAVVEGVL